MANTAATSPTVISEKSPGTSRWTDMANATSSNDTYAIAELSNNGEA